MDKTRVKIALAVFNVVRSAFFEINGFIDSTLKEECEKERMTGDEVIFLLLNFKKKISLDKRFGFRPGAKVIIFCL